MIFIISTVVDSSLQGFVTNQHEDQLPVGFKENEVDKRVKTELEVANNQASLSGLIWKKHSCGMPNAADTRFSALEFGECQSRCRNRQHKLH